MKIAVEINGVLRDTIEKFKQVYEKHMIDENLDETYVNPNIFEIDENGNEDKIVPEEHFEYKIISDVTSLILDEHFLFRSKEEYYSFNDFNDFYTLFRDDNEITIVSDEMGKSKPATLFFLSKFGCLAENIIFYNTVTKDKVLSSFDLIVTSNPDIIINYSDKLTIIKYDAVYNKQVKSEITINLLKELSEKVKEIQHAKII